MGYMHTDSLRGLLIFSIVVEVASVTFQILSMLGWDGVGETFVEIIHSTAIHIAYACISILTVILNSIILYSLCGVDDVYYFEESRFDSTDF